MKASIVASAAVACFVGHSSVNCYDLNTHAALSGAAATQSVLGSANALANLGLQRPIFDQAQVFPNSQGDVRSVVALIQDGAQFEDNNIRVIWHFFNPITGLG